MQTDRTQTRRQWLLTCGRAALGLVVFGLAPRRARAVDSGVSALLEKSPLVYISPLLRGGRESTCHAELWFAWIDGSVVVTVSSSGWKARSIDEGHARARIWVGDHGRWKGMLGHNEAFRKAPTFDARAEKVRDPELLDRLMAAYGKKYPGEIGAWEGRMRKGFADGSRVLIRYTPVGSRR